MPPRFRIRPLAWDTNHPGAPHKCGLETVNVNTARGFLYPDRGFKIDRDMVTNANTAGMSAVHRHSDGTERTWYVNDTILYEGATPTSIKTALAAKFAPAHYNMALPAGFSGYFNGTNSEAQLIRENSGGTALEAVGHDMAAPGALTTSFATSGGTIADGTYQIRVDWYDDDGSIRVHTAPSAVSAVVVVGGGGSATITVNEPGSTPARATHFRVAFTAVGLGDLPANFLYWQDFAVGAGNQVFTALPSVSTSQAFNDINGTYMQAVLPITGVDVCTLHQGRLFVAATTSNEVAFSKRNNSNQWYTTNMVLSGAETGWNAPVIGLASVGKTLYILTAVSIHIVYGSFRRDDIGSNATYKIDVATDVEDNNIGCVSHASIKVVHGQVFFFSTRGPAVLSGGKVILLKPDDIRNFVKNHVDWTYVSRIVCAEDPELNMVCWCVPRRTNSSRPQDGASTAGICDRVMRWDLVHGIWCPPLGLECVHLSTRVNGAQGATSKQTFLMANGPHGQVLRLGYGWSGGGPDDVSGTDYDGQTASASTTTTVTVALAGVSIDDYVGRTLTLYYPSDDANYPSVIVQKTVSTNTATTAGSVVFTWKGALTVPSGTNWTVRPAGLVASVDPRYDPAEYVEVQPGYKIQLLRHWVRYKDVVGIESVA